MNGLSVQNSPLELHFTRPRRRAGSRRKAVCFLLVVPALLLVASIALVSACQSPPPVTKEWTPLYLQLRLCEGAAQVQAPDASGWTAMEKDVSVTIEEKSRIVAMEEGARFCLGDGSTLELSPESVMEVQNPRTFPHLKIVLQHGNLTFVAQRPSYELVMPACPVELLNVPVRIRGEVVGEVTRLAVEEGAVTCALEAETLTLLSGREMYAKPGEEPMVTEFEVPATDAGGSFATLTPSPSATPEGVEPTMTSTPSPSPSPTPTATPSPTPTRRRIVFTPTSTPLPPTDTPAPPPPSKPDDDSPPPPPPPTESPPTEPPPPPPTESPPTEPPPPPPVLG